MTDKSGSTRSKANRMYKGNSRSGIITATQSSSSGDWYKLVLGSTQRVELDIITKSGGYSGGIKFSVYSGKKPRLSELPNTTMVNLTVLCTFTPPATATVS